MKNQKGKVMMNIIIKIDIILLIVYCILQLIVCVKLLIPAAVVCIKLRYGIGEKRSTLEWIKYLFTYMHFSYKMAGKLKSEDAKYSTYIYGVGLCFKGEPIYSKAPEYYGEEN